MCYNLYTTIMEVIWGKNWQVKHEKDKDKF